MAAARRYKQSRAYKNFVTFETRSSDDVQDAADCLRAVMERFGDHMGDHGK